MGIEHLRWKIIQRPLLPIMGSSVDAFPFLILFALLFLTGYALKNKKLRLRALFQAGAFIFFIFTVHRCFGAIRGWIFGIQEIAKNDLATFSNLFVFVPLVSFTIMFGRLFCGWLCPLGALQEFIFRIPVLKKFMLKSSPWLRGFKLFLLGVLFTLSIFLLIRLMPKTFFFVENIAAFWGVALILIVFVGLSRPRLEMQLKKLRYLSLGLWMVLIILDVYVTDPWCVLYGNVIDYSSFLALFAVMVSALFISMGWCRYLCPVGSFLSLLVRFSHLRIRQTTHLSSEAPKRICPVEALGRDSLDQSSCLYCSRCVQARVSEVKEA